VSQLLSKASVSAVGGPVSQRLSIALGVMCTVKASMSLVLCVVVSYSHPTRVPMSVLTVTHWVGSPPLIMT